MALTLTQEQKTAIIAYILEPSITAIRESVEEVYPLDDDEYTDAEAVIEAFLEELRDSTLAVVKGFQSELRATPLPPAVEPKDMIYADLLRKAECIGIRDQVETVYRGFSLFSAIHGHTQGPDPAVKNAAGVVVALVLEAWQARQPKT